MKKADSEYAGVLMEHLRRDCARYLQTSEWGPIVLWMAEEVRRQSDSLRLPRETAREMAVLAHEARTLVCRT